MIPGLKVSVCMQQNLKCSSRYNNMCICYVACTSTEESACMRGVFDFDYWGCASFSSDGFKVQHTYLSYKFDVASTTHPLII